MKLSKAHQLFQLAMLGEMASSTRAWYAQRINRLIREIGDLPIASVTVWDLREWRETLLGQDTRWTDHPYRPCESGGMSVHTVHGHIRAIKRFFGWLVAEGLLNADPAERIKKPALPRLPPAAIRAADVRLLVAAATTDRDRALLLFLFDTGCRCSGAVELRWNQVDFALRRAEVIEKGRESRIVFLSRKTDRALRALRSAGAGRRDRVFRFETGDGVRQALRRLAKRAGIAGPVNPHAFRHGWAIEALMNGADLATVSNVLGHKSVQVTADSYARFAVEWLAEQHAKYSPVARL